MKTATKVLLNLLFIFTSLGLLVQCSPTLPICTTNADCEQGYRCVKQVCQKYEPPNNPPEAKASGPRLVRQFSVVLLDGSASSDPDGQSITYRWSFAQLPPQSKAQLRGMLQPKASFEADLSGMYIVELVVTDSKGLASKPARVNVEAYGSDLNGKPIANAGRDQVIGLNHRVQLDGSQSSDPEDEPLTYRWSLKSLPQGSQATLSEHTTVNPTFVADKLGRYIVELIVNDGLDDSEPDIVSINAIEDFELQPVLDKIHPTAVFVDTIAKIELIGSGFSNQASVLLDGINIIDTQIKRESANRIVITVDFNNRPAKYYQIKVRNPNGKESIIKNLEVKELPIPRIEKLEPTSGVSGGSYDIKVSGSGFVSASEALFDLVPLPTTVINESGLVFKVNLSKTLPGKYRVQIRNPGNRISEQVIFTVIAPGDAPVITALSSPSAITGEIIEFSVHGSRFLLGAELFFAGKKLPSVRPRSDEIRADPHLDLTNVSPGIYEVWVQNPDGKQSNKEKFEVEDIHPTPALDRIIPFSVYLDDTNVLNVYGSRFRPGVKMFIDNHEISGNNLEYRSDTYFIATVNTNQGTWKTGQASAYLMNPHNKKSNTFNLTITHRIPSISSTTPSGWSNKCDTEVEVFGSNFSKNVQLVFDNLTYTQTSTTHKLTYVNDRHLKFQLAASKLSVKSYNLRVENSVNAPSNNYAFRIISDADIPKPEIQELRPAGAAADTSVAVLITQTATDKRFYIGAVAEFNGIQQPTTCRGSTSISYCYDITAEIDLGGVKPGEYDLRVVNPCGLKSNPVKFLVSDPPTPYISELSPAYAFVGDSKNLLVRGLNFSSRAELLFGGKSVPINVKSEKEIITTQPISFQGAQANTKADVIVDNGNNSRSSAVKFAILDKKHTPIISSVSANEFERGQIHNGLMLLGSGFSQNSEVYFNGKKVTSKFTSSFQLTADGLDFTSLAAGTYYIYVKEGANQSNHYPLLAKPKKPPVFERTSPTVVYENSGKIKLYLYGKEFCEIAANKSSCVQNPKIVIIGPNQQDFSSAFNITSVYISSYSGWSASAYVYGDFDTTGLKPDLYQFFMELPTGERSNVMPVNLLKTPPPSISSLSPTSGLNGQTISSFYIYGAHFCPSSGSTCSTNPIVRIIGQPNNTDYQSTHNVFNITGSSYSSTGSSNVRGPLNMTKMPIGHYEIQLEHPISKERSNVAVFEVRKAPLPAISYLNPNHAILNETRTFTLYGANIAEGAFLLIGLDTIPLSGSSTTSRTFVFDAKNKYAKVGSYKMILSNPNGDQSEPYHLMVVDPNPDEPPVVTRVSPLPMLQGRSYSLEVYGYNWDKSATPEMLLNGKIFSYGTRSCFLTSNPPYCRYTSFDTASLKPDKHTMQYKATYGGKTHLSNSYEFYISQAPPPTITSISPITINQGAKQTISINGSNFVSGAFATIGVNTYPLFFSSTTCVRLDPLDTTNMAKGKYTLVVVNPDQQKSNEMSFTIQ
jgi:hypothetical protein